MQASRQPMKRRLSDDSSVVYATVKHQRAEQDAYKDSIPTNTDDLNSLVRFEQQINSIAIFNISDISRTLPRFGIVPLRMEHQRNRTIDNSRLSPCSIILFISQKGLAAIGMDTADFVEELDLHFPQTLSIWRYPGWSGSIDHVMQIRLKFSTRTSTLKFRSWLASCSLRMQRQGLSASVAGNTARFWGKHKPDRYSDTPVNSVWDPAGNIYLRSSALGEMIGWASVDDERNTLKTEIGDNVWGKAQLCVIQERCCSITRQQDAGVYLLLSKVRLRSLRGLLCLLRTDLQGRPDSVEMWSSILREVSHSPFQVRYIILPGLSAQMLQCHPQASSLYGFSAGETGREVP